MANREASSQHTIYAMIEQELHQREQHLLEQLQEAQEAQIKALKRFQHAEARLLKRITRTQRIETRLLIVRQQLEAFDINLSPSVVKEEPKTSMQDQSSPTSPDTAIERARHARAIAEVTEHAARITIERAAQSAAEQSAVVRPEAPTTPPTPPGTTLLENVATPSTLAELGAMNYTSTTGRANALIGAQFMAPNSKVPERIIEIDEEEEMLEMVTSMMIADAAAIAAAKAEALAEASSARTREARRLAYQADKLLTQVRTAIEQGTLTGDAAEAALQVAERDVTDAQAAVADAEAAEERALSEAANAEAEAEVAEGMAFAVSDLHERSELRREEELAPHTAQEHTSETRQASNDLEDDEDTVEHPAVRPQEQI